MIDFASLANELLGFLDDILINIEQFISDNDNDNDTDTDNDSDMSHSKDDIDIFNFSNSLYDIYYYIFVLIKEEKLQGVVLSQFKYPNSFLINITNTPYSIIVLSCSDKINYNVYTAIKENDTVVKIDQLGYKDLYKEQNNNNSIIKEINMTVSFLLHKNQSS